MVTRRRKQLIQTAEKTKEILEKLYPDAVCSLTYDGDPWRLLAMSRLSAQCTDARVNTVSKELFKKYPTCSEMAVADISELEEMVRPCGLYRMKAKDLKIMSGQIEDNGGYIPNNMEDLLMVRGVGRKIANLVLGDVFGKGGIVADTHCIRICGRLGFYDESKKDPLLTERTMEMYIPFRDQSGFCHRLVMFGRDTCTARNPSCEVCPMNTFCHHNINVNNEK